MEVGNPKGDPRVFSATITTITDTLPPQFEALWGSKLPMQPPMITDAQQVGAVNACTCHISTSPPHLNDIPLLSL